MQAATEWDIVGVVTRSDARREELKRDAPELPAFDSLDDIIDAGADAVVISTPPSTRRELVLRALERGVHVVADKPFAPNLAGARELAKAADAAGRTLTVYQNRRWDTDFVTLRSVLDSGDIGTPQRANFVLDQDEPGTLEAGPGDGLLRDLGAHIVDQVIQLFGRVSRVDGHLDLLELEAGSVDVGFALGLHHESGVYSAVSASKLGYRAERGMLVYGSRGSYTSRMLDVQIDQLLSGERPSTAASWGVEAEPRWGVVSTESGERRIPSATGDYSEFYRQLHAALVDGSPPPVTLDEALHTIAVLDAARESHAEGRSIALN